MRKSSKGKSVRPKPVRLKGSQSAATRLRRQLGLPRIEFARLLGCSLASVYRWENGEAQPDGLYAKVFADLLRVLQPLSDETKTEWGKAIRRTLPALEEDDILGRLRLIALVPPWLVSFQEAVLAHAIAARGLEKEWAFATALKQANVNVMDLVSAITKLTRPPARRRKRVTYAGE